jgi:hypothetical protein
MHKLLVAHAIRMGSIQYLNGEVFVDAENNITIETEDQGPKKPPRAVLIRHGADNALVKLLEGRPTQLEKLISAQMNLSDDLIKPFWMAEELPTPQGYPPHNPRDQSFQNDRFLRAKPIERFWPHMRLVQGTDRFYIETADANGWWPKSLFGIPVEAWPKFEDAPGRPWYTQP